MFIPSYTPLCPQLDSYPSSDQDVAAREAGGGAERSGGAEVQRGSCSGSVADSRRWCCVSTGVDYVAAIVPEQNYLPQSWILFQYSDTAWYINHLFFSFFTILLMGTEIGYMFNKISGFTFSALLMLCICTSARS
jgi:hypothetical protein